MIGRGLLAAAIVWVAAPARAGEQCALVVAAQVEPDSGALAAARDARPECAFVADAALRNVLEGFDRPAPAEERAREAMARAHSKMRRFDTTGVHQALDEAWFAAAEVTPTPEGRQLVAQVALQEAELAAIERDADAQLRATQLALAIDPELKLDEGRASPAMIALLGRARAEVQRAVPITVAIASRPPGARVWAGGWRRETPAAVALPEGPAMVWLSRAGYRPRAVRLMVTPGAHVDTVLEALSDAERLRPLVDALRQSAPDARRQPALTLASALGVHSVVVLDPGGGAPTVFAPEPAPAPVPGPAVVPDLRVLASPPPPPHPWYKRAWPWVLIVGGAAVAAMVVGVGAAFGPPSAPTLTCCR